MDRKNFIRGLVTATAGFAVLPSALTYPRIWKPSIIKTPRYQLPFGDTFPLVGAIGDTFFDTFENTLWVRTAAEWVKFG